MKAKDLIGTTVADEVLNPFTGECLARKEEIISQQMINTFIEAGVDTIKIAQTIIDTIRIEQSITIEHN